MRPLTPKQQRFVDEYLIDLNATQAAIRAGYSAKTADKKGPALVGNSRIAAAIEAKKRERSERVELTQDAVIQGLLKEANLTGKGSSHSARVAAWAHLGKHLGMFAEQVEVKQTARVHIVEEIVEDGTS